MNGQRLRAPAAPVRDLATPPNVGIGRLLREASTTFNRAFRMQLAPLGVTYGQFQYLQSLWEVDGLTQTELTRKVGVEIAASTAILDSLEERKFIRRERNATDRRKIQVYLTPAGAATKSALMACAIATNATARHGISNAEIVALFYVLGRIVTNLRRSSAPESDDGLDASRPKSSRRTKRKAQS